MPSLYTLVCLWDTSIDSLSIWYCQASSDVPLLSNVRNLATRLSSTLTPSISDPPVLPPNLNPQFCIGFITPPFNDSKIPVTDHLHAHAFIGPPDLLGWWRGVPYGALAWYPIEDLTAEKKFGASSTSCFFFLWRWIYLICRESVSNSYYHLDEAHNIKNVKTKMLSLFASCKASSGGVLLVHPCRFFKSHSFCNSFTVLYRYRQINVTELYSLIKFLRIKPLSNLEGDTSSLFHPWNVLTWTADTILSMSLQNETSHHSLTTFFQPHKSLKNEMLPTVPRQPQLRPPPKQHFTPPLLQPPQELSLDEIYLLLIYTQPLIPGQVYIPHVNGSALPLTVYHPV